MGQTGRQGHSLSAQRGFPYHDFECSLDDTEAASTSLADQPWARAVDLQQALGAQSTAVVGRRELKVQLKPVGKPSGLALVPRSSSWSSSIAKPS